MQLSAIQILAPFIGTLPRAVAAPASSVNPVHWEPCPAGIPPSVQCANYSVPLDYSQPNGATVNLAIVRIKSNSTQSKGSIYINPGGPGGSGVNIALEVLQLPGSQPYDLLQDYDLVGVDPRGVGRSTPLKCDPTLWNKRVPTMISNAQEYNTLVQHWQAVGESCKTLTGPLFDHLDTIHVAQDFEQVRKAIGDDKFNFIGLSYGTQIGYTYAEMFPETVGRMVLDGMVDHSEPLSTAVQTESTTYEATLHKFFDWCQENPDCALHGRDIQSFFSGLVAKAQANPIPAPGCQQQGQGACQPNVSYEDLLYAVQDGMVLVNGQPPIIPGWADLAAALLAADNGNATALSPTYYTGETDTTGNWVELANGCQDWLHSVQSAVDLQAIQHMTNALSPLTQGFTQGFGYASRCPGWPAAVTNPQRAIEPTISKAPQILMVNAFWDPETSIEWALGVKGQISNSNLIFRNGSGHTSYALSGDTSKAVNGFLLEGKMPADGSVYQS